MRCHVYEKIAHNLRELFNAFFLCVKENDISFLLSVHVGYADFRLSKLFFNFPVFFLFFFFDCLFCGQIFSWSIVKLFKLSQFILLHAAGAFAI